MRLIKKGSVDRSVDLYIIDEATGVPATGLLFNTAGIDLKYRRDLSAAVAITEVTLAALTTAHTDGGFLEIGNGLYRLDVPDAAWATGADHVSIFGTITGYIVLPQTIQLVDYDPEDVVRMGQIALPNAAADAAGGLPISDAGGLDLDAKLANTNEITAARMGALTDWINGGRLDLILDIIAADTTTFIPALIAALNNVSAAQINAEVDTALADVGLTPTITGRIDAAISTRATPAQILTTVLTEAYAADGAAPTLSQLLFLLLAVLTEASITSTTMTAKKLDGSTAAATFTLNDASAPTSITRTS